jgi:hypothetical protein
MPEFQSFADFWPFYLHEHSRRGTRALHAAGTLTSTILLVALIIARKWAWLPLPLVIGRPATLQHPLWSFRGDYKMLALMLTGRLDAELARLRFLSK